MSEADELRRRMQALLDRLASERDPKEAARLMREYDRASAGARHNDRLDEDGVEI